LKSPSHDFPGIVYTPIKKALVFIYSIAFRCGYYATVRISRGMRRVLGIGFNGSYTRRKKKEKKWENMNVM
jgi:hypothetical protein